MGIPGIYKEIGPGQRVALVKLAIEKFEQIGRPLRVAIDTSIWSFQVQAVQGGTNPAIRTLYYRLLRLISVSVQPLFVFDGANKPLMKRNKHTARGGVSVPDMMFKQLLNYFAFPYHTAPGEAEAECALLQQKGIVDAVLSEDVDTLMFGCGITLRNWSSESSRGKVPTHVNMYDAQVTKSKAGLDREGMILVALLSGGDYDTNGVTGFGATVACQAARAGFGKDLCRISRSDAAGFAKWRENFNHEIRTNEKKLFKSKHKTLKLPDDFPKRDILGYYTHPVVSNDRGIAKLKEEITWDGEIDIEGLRRFVADAFEWRGKNGAKKFIRGFAPVLLVQKLRLRGGRHDSGYGDAILTAMNEMELVRAICGKRLHLSTDVLPEMRVIFHPNDIVGLGLDAEEDLSEDYGRDGLAPLLGDDQIEAYISDENTARPGSPSKRWAPTYDPTQPEKLWIAESIVKVGIPLKVEDYEESLRNPKKLIRHKVLEKQAATKKTAKAKGGMTAGAMDKFVKVTKDSTTSTSSTDNRSKPSHISSQPALPPAFLAPALEKPAATQPTASSSIIRKPTYEISKPTKTATRAKVGAKKTSLDRAKQRDPGSMSTTSSGLSISKQITTNQKSHSPEPPLSPINLLSSSPPAPPSRKHKHSPNPSSDEEAPPSRSLTSSFSTKEDLTPSSAEKPNGPSPRKKRAPITISPSLHSSPNTSGYSLPSFDNQDETSILDPVPVTRKLDFVGPFTQVEEQDDIEALPNTQSTFDLSSSPPPLPSTFPPKIKKSLFTKSSFAINLEEEEEMEAEIKPPIGREQPKKKKYIKLRESAVGSWKMVEREELIEGRSRAWRESQVEVLDLTGD